MNLSDLFEDMRNRGLVTFHHEDFIIQALQCPQNLTLVSLRLAQTKPYHPDLIDKMMLEKQVEWGVN